VYNETLSIVAMRISNEDRSSAASAITFFNALRSFDQGPLVSSIVRSKFRSQSQH